MRQVDKGIIPLHVGVGPVCAIIMRGKDEITMRIPDFDETVAAAHGGKQAAVRGEINMCHGGGRLHRPQLLPSIIRFVVLRVVFPQRKVYHLPVHLARRRWWRRLG